MMMKKLLKWVSVLSLLLVFSQSELSYAQTLAESREQLIESLMQGPARTFTYEEVDAYLTGEEARVLETGTIESDSTYGIEGAHSTGQGLEIYAYLTEYFEANTSADDQAVLYPYAVDFEALPRVIDFYSPGYDDYPRFTVTNEGGRFVTTMNSYNAYRTHLSYVDVLTSGVSNVGTEEVIVKAIDGSTRSVKANTQMKINLETPRRTDYLFYFIYNDDGGVSILMQEPQEQRETFEEAVTLESVDELIGSSASSWALPEDWRMLSTRRGDVPPVTWVLTSAGDGETIAIEPVFVHEKVVSGFVNPGYTVEAFTRDVYSGEYSETVKAAPDASGYFELNLDIIIARPPIVRVLDESGRVVYEMELPVYEYRPTALAHDSGYLTLERYFLDQNYMEGYAYPNADVTVKYLSGYAGGMEQTVQADASGYFYVETPGHMYNKTTNVVSTVHPETGETISVAPYPWTQEELDNAEW